MKMTSLLAAALGATKDDQSNRVLFVCTGSQSKPCSAAVSQTVPGNHLAALVLSCAYLPAARVTRLPQNIPKFLQVAPDNRRDLYCSIKPRSKPSCVRVGSRDTPERGSNPDSARSPPGAGVAAPSGPSGEPPPTAVRHFTLSACLWLPCDQRYLDGRNPNPALHINNL